MPEQVPPSDSSGANTVEVDWAGALAAVEGNRRLLGELVQIFFQEYPQLLAELRRAVEQQDARSVTLYAHRLKGCLRYFGTNRAGEIALEIEKLGRQEKALEAQAKYAALEHAVERLVSALHEFK